MLASSLLALAASLSTASAVVYKGFNYGAAADFENDFNTAKALVGTSGFTSARLYTMIKPDTTNTPTDAIQAAIDTDTTLLLGLWASAGQDAFNNEVAALNTAISQYGAPFTSRIAGISVGSEDLYRDTPLGIASNAGSGATADTLIAYIGQVRSALSAAGLPTTLPVGHVDTWTVYTDPANAALIGKCSFLGVDAYPYYQTNVTNSVANANATFWEAIGNVTAVANNVPVWVTETGWPVSGPTSGEAVPSVANAQAYWDSVGCSLFGNLNTFWYTLQDAPQADGVPSFGIVGAGSPPSTTPLFDLTCN